MASRSVITIIVMMWCSSLHAQPQFGEVSHWEDGSSMECPFIFQQEVLYEWDQSNPPPISIETAAAIARVWGERKGLTNVSGSTFRLIGVRPWEHDYPMLVMFVRYFGFPSGTRRIRSDDQYWLAITPTGTVVEPTCEGDQ